MTEACRERWAPVLAQAPGQRSDACIDDVCGLLQGVPFYAALRAPARQLAARHVRLARLGPESGDALPRAPDDRHLLYSVVAGEACLLHGDGSSKQLLARLSTAQLPIPAAAGAAAPGGSGDAAAPAAPNERTGTEGGAGAADALQRASSAAVDAALLRGSLTDGGAPPSQQAQQPAAAGPTPKLALGALLGDRGSDAGGGGRPRASSWGGVRATVTARSRFLAVGRDAAAASSQVVGAALQCIEHGMVQRGQHEMLAAAGFGMTAGGPGQSFSGDLMSPSYLAGSQAGWDPGACQALPARVLAAAPGAGGCAVLVTLSAAAFVQVTRAHRSIVLAERVDACCRLPFLRYTPLQALHQLAHHLQEASHQPGDVLQRQGADVTHVQFLLSGHVEVSVSPLDGPSSPPQPTSNYASPASSRCSSGRAAESLTEEQLRSWSGHSASPVGGRARKVLAVRGPGALLGDEGVRHEPSCVTVTALTALRVLRIAPLKLVVSGDKLTLRLLARLRLQHTPEQVAKAAEVTEEATASSSAHRECVLTRAFERTHGAVPHSLDRQLGEGGAGSAQPEWRSVKRTRGFDAAEPAAASSSSSSREGPAHAGCHHGLSGSVELPAWSSHIDPRFHRCGNSLRSGSPSPDHAAGPSSALSRSSSPVPMVAVEPGRGIQLPEEVEAAAAAAATGTAFTELHEDCCLMAIAMQQQPGQSPVQDEVLLAALDDILAQWAAIAHDEDLQLARWDSWHAYALRPLDIGSPRRAQHVGEALDSLLRMVASFDAVIARSGVPACRLCAGVAVGSVFVQHEGGHTTGVQGHCLAAAQGLCRQAAASAPGNGVLLTDGVQQMVQATHITALAGGAHRLQLSQAAAHAALDGLGSQSRRRSVNKRRALRNQIEAMEDKLAEDEAAGTALLHIETGALTPLPAPTPALRRGSQRPAKLAVRIGASSRLGAAPTGPLSPGSSSDPASPLGTCKTVSSRGSGLLGGPSGLLGSLSSSSGQLPPGIRRCPGTPSTRLSMLAAPRPPAGQSNSPSSPEGRGSRGSLTMAARVASPGGTRQSVLSAQQQVKSEVQELRCSSLSSAVRGAGSQGLRASLMGQRQLTSSSMPFTASTDERQVGSAAATATCADGGAAVAADAAGAHAASAAQRDDSMSAHQQHAIMAASKGMGSCTAAQAFADGLPPQTTAVDLSAAGLRQLPSLAHLQQLDSVAASFNHLTALPDQLAAALPAGLTSLCCAHNDITALPEQLFEYLPHLQQLDCSYNRLEMLPAGISQVPLFSLACCHNRLWQLPNDITQLHQLTELIADHNDLSDLPAGIGAMTKLRTLQLNNNAALRQLPPELGGLSALEQLGVAGCSLEGLPPGVLAALSALTALDLSANQLDDVALGGTAAEAALADGAAVAVAAAPSGAHAGPAMLPQLASLDVSCNLLTALPAWLPGGLVELRAGHNRLTALPEWACTRLTRLQALCIECNSIAALPPALSTRFTLLAVEANGVSDPGVVAAAGGEHWHSSCAAVEQLLARKQGYTSVASLQAAHQAKQALTPRGLRERAQALKAKAPRVAAAPRGPPDV